MGWTYNTVNPNAETNAPAIAAVGISFTAFALLVVSLRIYVRAFMIKAIGVDDWIIVFTWFMSLGFAVVTILQSKWGLGLQNLNDMPNENVFNFGLLQFIGAPFYITSILGFKLSLLFSFLRIAVEKVYRIGIIVIIVACTAFHFSFLMAQINLCQPISKQWNPAVTHGSCLVAVPMYTTMASLTIIFDVIIILTPFPMLLKTYLPTRKKVILLGIFSLGIFITVIQMIRILTIKSLANYLDSSKLIMWSMVENNLGIIVASIPPLSPLVRSVRDKTLSKSTKSTPNGELNGRTRSYALQSISGKNGFVEVGSGHDIEYNGNNGRTENAVMGRGDMESSSEELNLQDEKSKGIQKTTQVVVTRESRATEDDWREGRMSKYPY